MIEVRIPKEIREYKAKVAFNLTFRQLVCVVISLAICVPLYIYGKNYINEEVLGYLIMIIAVPIMLIGFFNYNQMNFETFIRVYMQMMINPQKRPYQEMPVYAEIRDKYLSDQRRDILDRINPKRKKEGSGKVNQVDLV